VSIPLCNEKISPNEFTSQSHREILKPDNLWVLIVPVVLWVMQLCSFLFLLRVLKWVFSHSLFTGAYQCRGCSETVRKATTTAPRLMVLSNCKSLSPTVFQFFPWRLPPKQWAAARRYFQTRIVQINGWTAFQRVLELRTFLGGQYEEVGELLAAGAKRITKLRQYLQQTEVTQLPSVSVTLQSLKPLCRRKLEMRPGRAPLSKTTYYPFVSVYPSLQ
jgi:hypothetical protein